MTDRDMLVDAKLGFWQAWFDGTACPNPGRIGIGVVLISPGGNRTEKCAPVLCGGCNNEAELHAMNAALALAHREGAKRIILRGDSDMAIRHVLGMDHTEIPRFIPLIAQAQEWLLCFDEARLQWIPGHRNQEADCCSRAALGLSPRPSAKVKSSRGRASGA